MENSNITRDKGTEFAERNIDYALSSAEANSDFSYLVRAIKIERRKIAQIYKTGDLVNYYDRFANGEHRHASAFAELASISNSFYPSERMADELRKRFPNELDHVTQISDFTIGQDYSSDFLSVVLGGSYAAAYRNSRMNDVSYIVMNPFRIPHNQWNETFSELFFYLGSEANDDYCKRFYDREKRKKTLVFEKTKDSQFVYMGLFSLSRVQGRNGVVFSRIDTIDAEKVNQLNRCRPKTITEIAATTDGDIDLIIGDILVNMAIENGIEYSLEKVDKLAEGYRLVVRLPNGFYELFSDYIPRKIIIGLQKNGKESDLEANREDGFRLCVIVSSEAYPRQKNGKNIEYYGWAFLADRLESYEKRYYSKILDLGENQTLCSEKGILDYHDIGTRGSSPQQFGWMISEFLFQAISADCEEDPELYIMREMQIGESPYIPDLVMKGHYGRIPIVDPMFEIKANVTHSDVKRILDKLSENEKSKIVFISLNDNITRKKWGVLVLGLDFVNQLARLYPAIAVQYLIGGNPTGGDDGALDRSLSEEELKKLLSKINNGNIARLSELIKQDNPISVITGNGTSIPYGAHGWQDVWENLLKQLKSKYLESFKNVSEFFGRLSFSVTDYSKDTLVNAGLEKYYWRSIKYSIYGRYSELLLNDKHNVNYAIAQAKLKKWNTMSIFTDNYDTFLEDEIEHLGIPGKVLSPIVNPPGLNFQYDWVVHVHGLMEKTFDPEAPSSGSASSIVLTQSEYFDLYRKPNNALQLLENALKTQTCLFIGSSLTDMFQMDMIKRNCSNSEAKNDTKRRPVYALMRLSSLGTKDAAGIYEYYKRKGILIITFNSFDDLPDLVRKLFR